MQKVDGYDAIVSASRRRKIAKRASGLTSPHEIDERSCVFSIASFFSNFRLELALPGE
jgi:hypothetical protein